MDEGIHELRACFEKGWRGRLARSGRRPADRNRQDATLRKDRSCWRELLSDIPSGESPDGTGGSPVLPKTISQTDSQLMSTSVVRTKRNNRLSAPRSCH